jgi:hypothetical protein
MAEGSQKTAAPRVDRAFTQGETTSELDSPSTHSRSSCFCRWSRAESEKLFFSELLGPALQRGGVLPARYITAHRFIFEFGGVAPERFPVLLTYRVPSLLLPFSHLHSSPSVHRKLRTSVRLGVRSAFPGGLRVLAKQQAGLFVWHAFASTVGPRSAVVLFVDLATYQAGVSSCASAASAPARTSVDFFHLYIVRSAAIPCILTESVSTSSRNEKFLAFFGASQMCLTSGLAAHPLG